MKMEGKMRSLKYLCPLFVVLAVNRVICQPIGKNSCSIPPELVKSSELRDIVENCRGDSVDINFCDDIKHLAHDISTCSLGNMWIMKEPREKLINSIRKMSFYENSDVCENFARWSDIEHYSSGDKVVGVRLSKDSKFCKDFCGDHSKVCQLLLKLYSIKKVVVEYKSEIDKLDNLPKDLPTQNGDASRKSTISSQSVKPNKGQIPEMVATPENSKGLGSDTKAAVVTSKGLGSDTKVAPKKDKPITDNREIDQKSSPMTSQVLPKSNINNQVSPVNQELSSSNDETKEKLPTTKNNGDTEKELPTTKNNGNTEKKLPTTKNNGDADKKLASDQQMKDNNVVPNVKKIEESKPDQTHINTADNNAVNLENHDENIKKDVPESTDGGDNKKVADAVNDKTPPEEEPKDLPNSIKDNPSESENGPNLEPEKNDKTEFGNQPNEFSDEFPDPSNDYAEEELPPTVGKEKTEDKTDSDKKLEITIGKGNGMGSVFPEEEDSHFFAYFLTIIVLCIAGYLVFHNKQKIIALIIEGRHERRRRPNGGYKRLDTKDSSKSTSQVIF